MALHRELLKNGISGQLRVHRKNSDDSSIQGLPKKKAKLFRQKVFSRLISEAINIKHRPLEVWSLGLWERSTVANDAMLNDTDIISLFWVSWFLDIHSIGQLLALGKPVVWTLFDMWAFTGGCHYAGACERYTEQCGQCPQIHSTASHDLSARVWEKKKQDWQLDNLTVVCPSHWLADCVMRSGLLRDVSVKVIASGIDNTVYSPFEKNVARHELGLPLNKKILLFIASKGFKNERKGGVLLEKALHFLGQKHPDNCPEIVILGKKQKKTSLDKQYKIRSLSFYDETMLAKLYSACDVLAAPSLADNLPLTVLEAMACGTPCVAYNIGGMPEVIEHKKNGYLANAFDVEDLANGLEYILFHSDPTALSRQATATINASFTLKNEARQYVELYEQLLSENEPTHD